MTDPSDIPPVSRESTEAADPEITEPTRLLSLELAEWRERERGRRVLRWAIPVTTVLWLGLVCYLILTRFISGIQAGIALGGIGGVLLTIFGIQVSWAFGGRRTSPTSSPTAWFSQRLAGNGD